MDIDNSSVMITGATGFIGSRLIEKLVLEHDCTVHALVRNLSHASRIARFNVEIFSGDIVNKTDVSIAASDCDYIFHCAYDFAADPSKRKKLAMKGAENLAEVALSNAQKIVHMSTIDVYGRPEAGIITESSPRNPDSSNIYATSKLHAENTFRTYSQKEGLPVCILQPAIVYGPYSRPWTHTPVHQLMTGKVYLPNNGKGICNCIYIDDVIEAMINGVTVENCSGESFVLSDGNPVTWAEFFGEYSRFLGRDSLRLCPPGSIDGMTGNNSVSNIEAIKAVVFDPYVQNKISRIPLMMQLFSFANSFSKGNLKSALQSNSSQQSPPKSDMQYYPDPDKMKLYSSQAVVKIDKAKNALNFAPRFDFERGIKLTKEYLEWCRFVNS